MLVGEPGGDPFLNGAMQSHRRALVSCGIASSLLVGVANRADPQTAQLSAHADPGKVALVGAQAKTSQVRISCLQKPDGPDHTAGLSEAVVIQSLRKRSVVSLLWPCQRIDAVCGGVVIRLVVLLLSLVCSIIPRSCFAQTTECVIVANHQANSIAFIDAWRMEVAWTIELPTLPVCAPPVVFPGASYAVGVRGGSATLVATGACYVALVDHAESDLVQIAVLDPYRSQSSIGRISLFEDIAFVTDSSSGRVAELAIDDLRVVDSLSLEPGIVGITSLSSEGVFWVLNSNSGRIHRVSADSSLTSVVLTDLTGFPRAIAAVPGADDLFVSEPSFNRVSLLDGATGKIKKSVEIDLPGALAVAPGVGVLLVVSPETGTLDFFDLADLSRVTSLEIGGGPVDIMVSEDERFAVAALESANAVAFVDVERQSLLGVVELDCDLGCSPLSVWIGLATGCSACEGECRECAGDCSGDALVAIDELVLGVSIALGRASVMSCSRFDPDGDRSVSIAELIRAIANSLNGCTRFAPRLAV